MLFTCRKLVLITKNVLNILILRPDFKYSAISLIYMSWNMLSWQFSQNGPFWTILFSSCLCWPQRRQGPPQYCSSCVGKLIFPSLQTFLICDQSVASAIYPRRDSCWFDGLYNFDYFLCLHDGSVFSLSHSCNKSGTNGLCLWRQKIFWMQYYKTSSHLLVNYWSKW